MKLRSLDPELVLAGIDLVREKLNHLNERASPGLKKLIEEYPMPFATVNRLLHYSEDLAKKALAIKEAFEKLAEIVSEPSPRDETVHESEGAMKKRVYRNLIEDISAASAATVWNCLPEIAKLPRVEGFERLEDYFRTAFITYFDGLDNWASTVKKLKNR